MNGTSNLRWRLAAGVVLPPVFLMLLALGAACAGAAIGAAGLCLLAAVA
jgi:hypothetical protein